MAKGICFSGPQPLLSAASPHLSDAPADCLGPARGSGRSATCDATGTARSASRWSPQPLGSGIGHTGHGCQGRTGVTRGAGRRTPGPGTDTDGVRRPSRDNLITRRARPAAGKTATGTPPVGYASGQATGPAGEESSLSAVRGTGRSITAGCAMNAMLRTVAPPPSTHVAV